MTNQNQADRSRDETAEDLCALLHRLGLAALVRDPASAEVLAASPSAEEAILGAEPGIVSVVTARIGGHDVRVEAIRNGHTQGQRLLTPRQREVADFVMAGRTNQEIGREFGISEHTVRRHVEEILRRLGVGNRKQAAEELRRRHRAGTLPGRPGDGSATTKA